jgi:hypothetical protein
MITISFAAAQTFRTLLLLDEVAWPNDGQRRPRSESEART